MVRTATAILGALLFISMAVILFGTDDVPASPTTEAVTTTPRAGDPGSASSPLGVRPAEASFLADDGSGEIARHDVADEPAAVPSTPLAVEVRDVATGTLCSRLPLHIRWRKPGQHWGSDFPGAVVDGGRGEIERSRIPADGELLVRAGDYTWPLVSSDLPVDLIRGREEPLVFEVDTDTWQAIFLTDPDGKPIATKPYAHSDSVRLIADARPGWLWVATETCPSRRVELAVGKLPWAEAELPPQRSDAPVTVVVPFPWDLRVQVTEARDAARYSIQVLLPESMERRPHGLAKYHMGPATLGEDTPGTFRDAHPRGEPRPIWRLGLNGHKEAVLRGFAEPGTLEVALLDIDTPVARTTVELDGLGGERVVVFEVAEQGAVLEGRVVDADGAPIGEARLLLDPADGREEDYPRVVKRPDPNPAVQVETDSTGRFRLPVHDGMDGSRFVLVHASGYGRRVFTIDELRATTTVELHPGWTVRMTAADRDGRPVSESTSWSTNGASRLVAMVELDHGVWRPASDAEWSEGLDRNGIDSTIGDIWIFDDLPAGELRFTMTGMGADCWQRHDAGTPNLHWVGSFDNDELMLGK